VLGQEVDAVEIRFSQLRSTIDELEEREHKNSIEIEALKKRMDAFRVEAQSQFLEKTRKVTQLQKTLVELRRELLQRACLAASGSSLSLRADVTRDVVDGVRSEVRDQDRDREKDFGAVRLAIEVCFPLSLALCPFTNDPAQNLYRRCTDRLASVRHKLPTDESGMMQVVGLEMEKLAGACLVREEERQTGEV
jgi:hypothetical protein